MTSKAKLVALGIALFLWGIVTAVVYFFLWTSPTFKWGSHPAIMCNTYALLFASFLFNFYRWKPSILFGLHSLLSTCLYMGGYLMITTGLVNILQNDYSMLGRRYVIMTSILVPGACIDLWFRIRHYRRQTRKGE